MKFEPLVAAFKLANNRERIAVDKSERGRNYSSFAESALNATWLPRDMACAVHKAQGVLSFCRTRLRIYLSGEPASDI
jgi:hypothetical protein